MILKKMMMDYENNQKIATKLVVGLLMIFSVIGNLETMWSKYLLNSSQMKNISVILQSGNIAVV